MINTIKTLIVEKLGVDPAAVTKEASFGNELGADSLDVYELLMAVEKEFGIEIPDEEAEKLTTVGLLIDYVSKHAHHNSGNTGQ